MLAECPYCEDLYDIDPGIEEGLAAHKRAGCRGRPPPEERLTAPATSECPVCGIALPDDFQSAMMHVTDCGLKPRSDPRFEIVRFARCRACGLGVDDTQHARDQHAAECRPDVATIFCPFCSQRIIASRESVHEHAKICNHMGERCYG